MTVEELKQLASTFIDKMHIECNAEDLVNDLILPIIRQEREVPEEMLEKCASICEKIATNHWRRESYSHEQVAVALEGAADKIRCLNDT